MNNSLENNEFDVLGVKIKLKQGAVASVTPRDVVELVQNKIAQLKKMSPQLDNHKLMVLVSLDLAKEMLEAKASNQQTLESLEHKISKAYELLESDSVTMEL